MPAQTKFGLFHQLVEDGYAPSDLDLIGKAYDLSAKIYSGRFQASGVPFLNHSIGSASLLSSMRVSPALIAASLVHNIYAYADFWFGIAGPAKAKRKFVTRVLGSQIEEYLFHFPHFFLGPKFNQTVHSTFDSYLPYERQLLLMSLAETAEKISDLRPLFQEDADSIKASFQQDGPLLIEMCRRMDASFLADDYSESIKRLVESEIPATLRRDERRSFSISQMTARRPLSFRRSPAAHDPHSKTQDSMQAPVTNVQLYRQMLDCGYALDDVVAVFDAYDCAITLFAGVYDRYGDTFINHLVRSAGVLVAIRAPVSMVIAALLHPVYRHGNFGSSLFGENSSKQELLRNVFGSEIESLLTRYDSISHSSQVEPLDQDMLLMKLACETAEREDCATLNHGHSEIDKSALLSQLAADAEKAGYPLLATELSGHWPKTIAGLSARAQGPFRIDPLRLTTERAFLFSRLTMGRIVRKIQRL